MEGFKYTTYLIGSMETTAEGDFGERKRERIVKSLLERKIFPVNPCTSELQRTGMDSTEMSEKLIGWVAAGHWDKFVEYTDLIWKGKKLVERDDKGRVNLLLYPGDIHYVEISDWITALYSKGDSPCGTFGEAFYAYLLNKPIYLITDCPKKELKKSFLGWVLASGGEVFDNNNQYLEYVDKKYELKGEKEEGK